MAAAERWEYIRIKVDWSETKVDWVASFSDIGDIEGFVNTLDYFGQQGWELVAVEPKEWNAPKE